MIIIITTISLILTVWFRSDAWLEYTRIFKLDFLSKYRTYDAALIKDPLLEYHDFLRKYYNCFFIRLITCPVCFATWLGLIFGYFTYISFFPIYTIMGLIIYLIIDRLLG